MVIGNFPELLVPTTTTTTSDYKERVADGRSKMSEQCPINLINVGHILISTPGTVLS